MYLSIASTVGITVGPDGNIWSTGEFTIGHVSSSGQDLVLYSPWPGRVINPYSIAAGSDGHLWIGESFAEALGRMDTAGNLVEIPVGETFGGVIRGSDGNIWFMFLSAALGRATPAGDIKRFPLPRQDSQAVALTNAADGGFWYADRSSTIAHMTITGTVNEYPLPNSSWGVIGICGSPDGGAWFTEGTGTRIGHITASGAFSEFPLPQHPEIGIGEVISCVWGPDGNLWFTEEGPSMIARMTPTGTVTEFPGPSPGSLPYQIIVGPGRTLWFTEKNGGRVGRVTLP